MQTIKIYIKKYLIVFILVLATFLRIYNLANNPPHLTSDEASLGYNAYSILKTGKDEYGTFLPIIFKSFGDYKPGLYVYTIIPFVATLGLNEFSTRLPSAIAGILAVWLVYKIIKNFDREKLAYTVSFLLAINPWHVYFSRGAWEINLCLTLTLAGVYFFLKSFRNQMLVVPSISFFALTLVTYQGAKLSSFIVCLILLVIYKKELLKLSKRYLGLSALLGVLIAVPIVLSLFNNQAGRLSVFSVFSYPRSATYLNAQLAQGSEKLNSLTYYLFHSEKLNFTRGVLGRYFNHYSGRFLFFEGDWQNPRHSPPNHGLFFVADIVLFVFGLVGLIRYKWNKLTSFIFLWLVLSPLPSALSRDQVHAVRSFNMVVPLVIVSGVGLMHLYETIKNLLQASLMRKLVYVSMAIAYLFGFLYFLDAYFVHLPKHNSKYWMYGYKQMVEYVSPIQDSYSLVRVQQDYAQPYIFFLFYQKYDPETYQQQANLSSNGSDVGQVENIDSINFTQVHWTPLMNGKSLVVSNAATLVPAEANVLKEIYYPDGLVAFRVSETVEK